MVSISAIVLLIKYLFRPIGECGHLNLTPGEIFLVIFCCQMFCLIYTFIAPEIQLPATEAKAKMGEVSSDSVTLTFVDPFTQRNGKITGYSIIVTTDKSDPDISGNKGLLNTWKDGKKSWLVS